MHIRSTYLIQLLVFLMLYLPSIHDFQSKQKANAISTVKIYSPKLIFQKYLHAIDQMMMMMQRYSLS
jgi:hypothetical protein